MAEPTQSIEVRQNYFAGEIPAHLHCTQKGGPFAPCDDLLAQDTFIG